LKVKCNSEGIELAVKAIKDGNVVVFPTDTVYGIGCDPFNSKAVEKIYHIKQRQSNKLLPVLGYSKDELSAVSEFNGSTVFISEQNEFSTTDLNPNIDFYINLHAHLGSLLIVNGVIYFIQIILAEVIIGGLPGWYILNRWFALNPLSGIDCAVG